MNGQYTVEVFQAADLGQVPGPEIFWMGHFGEWFPLHVYVGVVRGDGHVVLINTGPPEDLLDAMNATWRKEIGPKHQISIKTPTVQGLARLGITPGQVDAVVVTPLQAYAIGNIDRFPNARICISRRGWVDLVAPRRFEPRRPMAVPDRLLRYLLFDAWHEQRLRLLEDEDEILPGVRTWWAGTHHRSSLCVEVATEQGNVALADAAFYYANLEEDRPLGISESMEECRSTYARIRRSSDIFVSLYDPATSTRFPSGCVERPACQNRSSENGVES